MAGKPFVCRDCGMTLEGPNVLHTWQHCEIVRLRAELKRAEQERANLLEQLRGDSYAHQRTLDQQNRAARAEAERDQIDRPKRKPTWQCEFCGRFYSERTAKAHARCQQEQDRKDAESMWPVW